MDTLYAILLVFVIAGSSYGYDDSDIANAQTSYACERLFRLFEDALLSDGGNMYKLRHLLYPPTSAPPELANVTYHLQFTIANGGSTELPDSSGELPTCPGTVTNRTLNTSGIVSLRYGWTTIGIYTLIHPALLAQMQVQLPFEIMRLVTPHGIPSLWNGHNQLPSTSINLTANLTCLPGDIELDGVLKTLTSYVSAAMHSPFKTIIFFNGVKLMIIIICILWPACMHAYSRKLVWSIVATIYMDDKVEAYNYK